MRPCGYFYESVLAAQHSPLVLTLALPSHAPPLLSPPQLAMRYDHGGVPQRPAYDSIPAGTSLATSLEHSQSLEGGLAGSSQAGPTVPLPKPTYTHVHRRMKVSRGRGGSSG
jgi:hypothetical protein